MATRFINLDMLPGIELKDVMEAGSVLVKDDIFAMRDVVYIVARMDENAVGYKFGCVAKSRVKGTDKHVESGKIKILLDEIEECAPFNMGGIKEIGENYWYQKYLRMPAKVENKDIVDFMRESFKTNRSKLLNEGNDSEMAETKKVEATKEEPKKVVAEKKEDTKAKATSTRAKRTSRAKTQTKKATSAKSTDTNKSSDTSKAADKKVEKTEQVALNVDEPKKEEVKTETAKKTGATRSRKRTTTAAKKTGTQTKARAGRTGGTGRATKRNTGDGKVTNLSTRRSRKTVAEKAAEAKKVSEEISRRAGRTGATGNRSGGTATAERPKREAAKSTSTKPASRSTRVSVRDAVAKEKDALKASEPVSVVDTVSAITDAADSGSSVTVDVKNNKLEISMNFVMDRANFVEGELSQLNFFMEHVVSSMFKMKAVYEWTSEEEKQYIVENWIESIMEDLRSDEAKAKRLVDYVKKSKNLADWEVGLVMRKMIADSLKNNDNVHFVYEVRGLTDKQKEALEKLVKQNKLEVDLNIA